MSRPESTTRRRFVAGLVGAAAIGVAGGAVALLRREDELGPVASGGASTSTSPTTGPPSMPAPEPTTTSSSPPAVGQLEVLCRDAWGAGPAGAGRPHVVSQITVHHSATRLDRNADVIEHLRRFQSAHQARGWPDLAYHYVIDAEGHVFEARSMAIAGDTATDYDPTGHFLALCDGNFEEQPVPAAQFEGLARLLAWAVRHHGLSPDAISTHRDHAATLCPGQALAALVDGGQLAARVHELLAAGGVAFRLVCGDEAAARVAAIESA